MMAVVLITCFLASTGMGQSDPLDRIANSFDEARINQMVDRGMQQDMQANKAAMLGSYAFGLERQIALMQQKVTAMERENEQLRKEVVKQDGINKSLAGFIGDVLKAMRAKDAAGLDKSLMELNRKVDARNYRRVIVKTAVD
jgi:hypothetical protein